MTRVFLGFGETGFGELGFGKMGFGEMGHNRIDIRRRTTNDQPCE